MKALAIFHDHGTHPLSPLLKRGFKHVFAAIPVGGYWVVLDAAEGLPAVFVSAEQDLAGWYRAEGHTVVEVERGGPIRSPLVLASCVGFVKAVLGIRSFAVTPWQLYMHLTRFTP